MKIQSPTQYTNSIDNLKCLFYGQTGSGKTTLLSNFPNPFVVDMEYGLGRNKPFRATIDHYDDFEELIELLQTQDYIDHFQTIGFDSLNELIEIHIRDVILDKDKIKANRLYEDQLTQNDYGKIARDINKLVRKIISQLSPFYNLVFLCAEQNISYDTQQRNMSLTGKVLPETLPRLMDIVGCIFTKGNDHLLTINNSSFAVGKNRYGVNANPFPSTYQELINKISEE